MLTPPLLEVVAESICTLGWKRLYATSTSNGPVTMGIVMTVAMVTKSFAVTPFAMRSVTATSL